MIQPLNKTGFARELKELRKRARVTQQHVADELGYDTAQFISNWERAVSEPPPVALPVLAKVYHVSRRRMLELYSSRRLGEANEAIRQARAVLS